MQPLPFIDLDAAHQRELLGIARRSIAQGLSVETPLQVSLDEYVAELREPAAVFITLTQNGELRGCVGSLQAQAPLVQAVADYAFHSAFRDRRFARLGAHELQLTSIEISVLSALQELQVDSREALLRSLRPGVDGLVLEDRGRRATFLPKVWDKIGTPAAFLEQLLLKAGLPAEHWSESLRVQRYSARVFAEN